MRTTLLSWNVAGRVRRLAEQADRIIAAAPDLICLQEVTPATAERWRTSLEAAGWTWSAFAVPIGANNPRRRPLSVMTAARRRAEAVPIAGLPWPERALAVSYAGLELVNAHSPISPSPGMAKVLTHEALYEHLAAGTGPRVICGDLNTPRREHSDGSVWTFARDRYGRLRRERGERWDQAELSLIKGLERRGFRDAFRAQHGNQVRELSWTWPRWAGGYRLDHLIASDAVQVHEISYLHEWRSEGLSDHSPLSAILEWEEAGGSAGGGSPLRTTRRQP